VVGLEDDATDYLPIRVRVRVRVRVRKTTP